MVLLIIADDAGRGAELVLRRNYSTKAKNTVLLKEKDTRFEIEMNRSNSGEFILISINSKLSNEIWTIDCSTYELQKMLTRIPDRWYTVDYFGNSFVGWYQTLDSNYLFRYSYTEQKLKNIYQTSLVIDDIQFADGRLFFTEYEPFNMTLKSLEIDNSKRVKTHKLGVPYAYIEFAPTDKRNLEISIESIATPPKRYGWNSTQTSFDLLKEEVFGYVPYKSKIQSKLTHTTDSFGQVIPILIAYDAEACKDSISGLYMESYAAYGNLDYPVFESEKIVLMRKGFVIARPILRGSGSLGRSAYLSGTQMEKKNTFNDFKTSLFYLMDTLNLNENQVFIKGTSAGGLIMGVMANDSDLSLGGILLDRPFLNLSASMKDSSNMLTTLEYEEWGDPNNAEVAKYQRSYSPLQNINSSKSNLFYRAGYYDEITPVSAILESKLKQAENQTSDQLILLKTEMRSGHEFPFNTKRLAEEYAFMQFVLSQQD